MTIKGFATATATAQYHDNFRGATNLMGDLTVSQAGFGCYRIDPRVHQHHQALQTALAAGINLIDTSTNYGDGQSEQLVGHLVGMAIAGGQIARDQVVIVSKVGYLQGGNFDESERLKEEGNGWPDLVPYAQGLEHCIHPDFIASQLTDSLERLNMETLDVLLLHNPEYYLGWALKAGVPLKEAREIFYTRITAAFTHLEQEVAAGRIRAYGVSSNTFVDAADSPRHTSITQMWEIAESISPNHHFRVVQLPMNLLETGAVTERNQPNGQTVLQFAAEKSLSVLVNRPLNAVVENQIVRLADVPQFDTVSPSTADAHFDTVVALEHEFQAVIVPQLPFEEGVIGELCQLLQVGHLLQARWQTLGTVQQWVQTLQSYVLPRLNHAIKFLQEREPSPETAEWLTEYAEACNRAFHAVEAVYGGMAGQRAQAIRDYVCEVAPEWSAGTLSQTAVRAVRATEGVTTVLVGMRVPEYVADVVAGLDVPVVQSEYEAAWGRFGRYAEGFA